jgi:hypothetical protein
VAKPNDAVAGASPGLPSSDKSGRPVVSSLANPALATPEKASAKGVTAPPGTVAVGPGSVASAIGNEGNTGSGERVEEESCIATRCSRRLPSFTDGFGTAVASVEAESAAGNASEFA